MSRIRALAKESLVYGVSSIFSRFLSFLLVPFYTHVLSLSEFGVSSYIFVLIAFLNLVYQLGFDTAYLRLAQDENEEGRRRLFSTAFYSQATAAALFTVVLILLTGPLSTFFLIPLQYQNLLYLAGGILILDTVVTIPFMHLRLVHQAGRFASFRLANVMLNLGANWLFVVVWQQGLTGVFRANLLASAGTLLLMLPVFFTNIKPVYNRLDLNQLMKLGLPLIPAGLYGLVNEMAGRIFLRFLSPADIERLYPGKGYDVLQLTAIFAAAWKLGIFGLLLVQMYRMAWMPFFLQRQKDPDAAELFGRILRYLCLFIGYSSVTLMAFLDQLIAFPIMGRTLFHSAYWVGLEIVPGVLLAYVFTAWFTHFTLGIYIAKQTKYLMWSNGAGALVTIVGNLLLIPRFGLWGATVSAVLCYAVISVMVTFKSQKLFPIQIAWPAMIPILLWMAGGWIFGILVQRTPMQYSFLFRSLFLLAFYAFPFLVGIIRWKDLLGMRRLKKAI